MPTVVVAGCNDWMGPELNLVNGVLEVGGDIGLGRGELRQVL